MINTLNMEVKKKKYINRTKSRSYLGNMKENLIVCGEWKTHLTLKIRQESTCAF